MRRRGRCNIIYMKYNYQEGFVAMVALFVLLAFAYIVGGGVVARETAQNQASALASLRAQENVLYE